MHTFTHITKSTQRADWSAGVSWERGGQNVRKRWHSFVIATVTPRRCSESLLCELAAHLEENQQETKVDSMGGAF